jgi:23S rRNA (guanosine2251-2'-O)-methyltransferase
MKNSPRKKGEQSSSRWIYGLRVVREYLIANPNAIQTLHVLSSLTNTEIKRLAEQTQVPIYYETLAFFSSLGQGGGHQGVAAQMHPFPYVSLPELLEKKTNTLLILDEVVDPRNLGALLRTAEATGVRGIILTKERTAPLSATVEKAAVGATAHVSLCRVGNLSRALAQVKEAGFWSVGLAPDASRSLYEVDFPEKIAFLLGGEEQGLRPLTKRMCDFLVALPMLGKIQSLNVSVAGAVALYELLRRKTHCPLSNRHS